MNDSGGHNVELYVYDLTQGMATMMSAAFLGRQIDGIWHTAVVVFGREYFYGSHGISSVSPGTTIIGQPQKVEKIGETFIPYQIFKDYVRGLAESTFRGSNYNLLRHNCNSFSDDLCQFLCGSSIPKYILDLPQDILSTPLGQSLAPLIESLTPAIGSAGSFSFEPQVTQRETSPGFEQLNTEIDDIRLQSLALEERRQTIQEKLNKKDKKEKKKKKKKEGKSSSSESDSERRREKRRNEIDGLYLSRATMDELGIDNPEPVPAEMLPSEQVMKEEEEERQAELERRKNREHPILFENIDVKTELEELVKLIDDKLTEEEKVSLEELHQYLLLGEGSWALGDNFLAMVGKVLRDPQISTESRVHLLRALAVAAFKDDVILLLHQDRKDHILMNYCQDIDKIPPEEQQALALFICNLFDHTNASEWLLYISEWTYGTTTLCNIRSTVKVAVHCLLSQSPNLQDIGSALVYNLGIKEVKTVVFDDVAVELSMALLQFFNMQPDEERLFRAMKALSGFITVSPDIPQLVAMIGPHPKDFRGKSARIDALIDIVCKKVR